jgi:hypothetical protein
MDTNETIIGFGDPIKAGELFALLGVTPLDFEDGQRESNIKSVMEFLMKQEDPEYFVRRSVGAKQVDRIQFMAEYIDLYKKLEVGKEKLAKINENIDKYFDDDVLRLGYATEKIDVQNEISAIKETIDIYEK